MKIYKSDNIPLQGYRLFGIFIYMKCYINPKWRHEYKYFSPEYILTELEHRVSSILHKDMHVGDRGYYHIRSIYFDDFYDNCYYENENGTDPREKFRIRIYNNSDSRITLELKQRKMGKCHKLSAPFTLERLNALIKNSDSNNILVPTAADDYIYKKFYSELLYKKLHPVNIVCYDRVPYVNKIGNVRVTFDRNIKSGDDFSSFFDKNLALRPILPVGTNLIEVKFDELLPDYIYDILQTGQLRQTSFSKYYLCRKYNMKSTL